MINDCIIINSVIQYFPSINYLVQALKKLVKAAKTNSTIIIGDVRSLELLELFLLEKIRSHTDQYSTLAVLYYKSRELEILLSPYFFNALKKFNS